MYGGHRQCMTVTDSVWRSRTVGQCMAVTDSVWWSRTVGQCMVVTDSVWWSRIVYGGHGQWDSV